VGSKEINIKDRLNIFMAKRILVVEDDTSIRELLVELLESEGYVVSSAVNGLEGLKILHNSGNPDLILIDLMMPVMDGYSFRTEQLKNPEWSKIPTVVMSAEANAKEKMKNFNITAFLSKPVELETILKTVARFS
jgi:CheY-like chemotaxis protein